MTDLVRDPDRLLAVAARLRDVAQVGMRLTETREDERLAVAKSGLATPRKRLVVLLDREPRLTHEPVAVTAVLDALRLVVSVSGSLEDGQRGIVELDRPPKRAEVARPISEGRQRHRSPHFIANLAGQRQ